jgi:putative transposase
MSLRQACVLFYLSTSVYYYQPKQSAEDENIRQQLRSLAELHSTWGFWMMFNRLRALSHRWNHKKVYRVYTGMKLNLRRKYKRRLPVREKVPLLYPVGPNITWSMDFVHDGLISGKSFRSFNVIDDFNREALNITLATSLTSNRVIRELRRLIDWRGKPEKIRVDNGPEFIAVAMVTFCQEENIELFFIQKGKPTQNGFVERFNRTFRDEVLNQYLFESIKQAQVFALAWMWIYNTERPHSSLLNYTPHEFLLKYGKVAEGFPTFQQDINFNWNSLLLNVAT